MSFEIIASKVSRIPVPSFGYIWPKKTPRYNGSKKTPRYNVWAYKTTSNIGWTKVKIKPTKWNR
jgi:hypothetical protein